MRIIIIIQSIIILLGAYYVYMQSQSKVVVDDTVPAIETVPEQPVLHEGYTPPTENPPDSTVDVSSSSTVTGPSDSGMEYPTMDTELPETR